MWCTGKHFLVFGALISGIALLISCSPSAPQKGTPAFYWLAAKETYTAGDYTKTLEHLDELLATDNDYTSRALPWSLVVASGMASGHMELADNYARGVKAKREDATAFYRQVNTNRGLAKRLVLQVAENFGKLDKVKSDTVPLAFGVPKGSVVPIPQFSKLSIGMPLPPAEVEDVQRKSVERGVLLKVCEAAGAANDPIMAEQVLKAADAQVTRSVFMKALAASLYEQAQLFAPDRLDERDKLEIIGQRAQIALKAVPDSKDTKDLGDKIQKLMKKPGKKT
jgi:hypothetical protein